MFKNVKFKIVLALILISVLLAVALEMTNLYYLNDLTNKVTIQSEIGDAIDGIEDVKYYSEISSLVITIVFSLVIVIVGIVISNVFIAPISNLIKTAEDATKGVKFLGDGNSKKKNDIDSLAFAFDTMNNELKENLTEATRQKKQMETILIHMTDGIIAFNIDGQITHINPAAKEFLNLNDDSEPNNFNEVFDKYNLDINLEKIIYLEDYTTTEKKINLNERSINLFFAPFKNENDRPAGLIVVIQDITEHVKLDSMRKRFVADVSHELKTPITSIMGYSETLLENEVDEETSKKFLNRISSESERMSKLVTDLLTLSKYDLPKDKIEKEEFDLGDLVKYIFEGQEIEMKKKEQKSECFVTSNVPIVYANKGGIERVIINVLTNAIKYTPNGGEIKAYVGSVNNNAYIKIIDTGIGIPKEDLDKIFERFYRVDKARTREMGGTGLGLSIAKEIIDQNDCTIDFKSEVGKGTEVVIRIPTFASLKNKEKVNLSTEE